MSRAVATAHTSASPAAVYALLRDGSTWPTWIAAVRSMTLEREGGDGGETVGAIRVFRIRVAGWSVTSREAILGLDPDRCFSYAVLSGAPFKDHRAAVELSPATNGGTDIVWSATWRPSVPGTGPAMAAAIRRIYRGFSRGLAAAAAERHTDTRRP